MNWINLLSRYIEMCGNYTEAYSNPPIDSAQSPAL